jgi:hypothetical protein
VHVDRLLDVCDRVVHFGLDRVDDLRLLRRGTLSVLSFLLAGWRERNRETTQWNSYRYLSLFSVFHPLKRENAELWTNEDLTRVISVSFLCVYLHFKQDPAALQRSNPQEYARLVDAWARLKPDLLAYPTHQV